MSENTSPENQNDNTSQDAPQQKQRPSARDIEQMKYRRDMAIRKRAQAIREAKTAEEREALFIPKAEKVDMSPTDTKGKLENFWYHYRTNCIIVGFILILVIIFIVDLATQQKYDSTINSYTGQHFYSEDADIVEQKLESFIKNPSGKKNANIQIETTVLDVNNNTDLDHNDKLSAQVRYLAFLNSAEQFLMLVSPEVYSDISRSGGVFVDLESLCDEENENVDGDKLYIENIDYFDELGNTDGLMLVLLDAENSKNFENKKVMEQFEYDKSVLKTIINTPSL